ncbi:hypothetical protein ALNOE001_09830 [Candidatus Methanobinarius endosymbioticus]|uniref:Uncharacterized protein n=1 Tax=Candidatus Methanobinarius endosymbioticus TaxID=2006182 RepID=A0A366MD55_9EURY|nr:hypothetical protein ALNOE001_09830 [Candidatus Methanobinarius endosymbioticus]
MFKENKVELNSQSNSFYNDLKIIILESNSKKEYEEKNK